VTVIEQHKPLWLPVNSRYISPMKFLKSSNITKFNIYATITAQNWFISWTGKIKVIRTNENKIRSIKSIASNNYLWNS
jgi:hypothetical protein